MGAGCSNGKATKVQDSVKAKDIVELSKEAQEQLKLMQAQNPDQSIDVKKLLQANKEEEDVKDKDMMNDNIQRLKHQELWLAVELNNQEKVTSYLDTYEEKSGEELKEAELYDHTGNSVIHKAASLGHAEVLMLLLERTGATPDLVNASLATPLHLACKNDRLDAAKFLIGCGVDANMQDEHGQMPLLICTIHGHFELARLLIEANGSGHLPEPLEVDQKDHRGLSPLNCAAIKGDFDMTKLLVLNGGANIDGASPKGCTPLLYAARGGYAEVVRFLLLRGASALRQDNAGGTVLHHAVEKGHIEVLQVLLEHGVDVHSAIEIPDNAGRTPIYEAIDNHDTPDMLLLITKSRKEGGFDAKVNIMNYNGQTPLFSAAREGNIEVVKALVENCDAKLDMTQGELYKEEYDEQQESYQSLQEKFFMDAYKNCMTPLHVAVVLGYEDIMLYLIEKGANPNLQTKIKGYSCLHLAVLANKPEIIIELLTKTQANPYLPDFAGRVLQDMVEIFIPSYLDSFKTLLENLQSLKTKGIEEESLSALASRNEPVVVRHYYNPDDERSIKGLDDDLVKKAEAEQAAEKEGQEEKKDFATYFQEIDEKEIEKEIQIETDAVIDPTIETVYGRKIAVSFCALDWKFKEMSMKLIYKQTDKYLDMQNKWDHKITIDDIIKASVSAISLTSREKVIKVFSISLQLLSLLISSTKIEKTGTTDILKNAIVERNVVLKLLQKSEEGNTRITNKIHECLLDLSFNPEIGEALTSSFILQRINAHNRSHLQKQAAKKIAEEGKQSEPVADKIDTEATLGSYKGLLAQLALLYKFINSFGIASKTRGPLSVKDILKAVLPAVAHPNQDVRNASGKILLDVHKLSGCVTAEELSDADLNEKAKAVLLEKLAAVEIEKNLNTTNARVNQSNRVPIQEEDGDDTDQAIVPETISTHSPSKAENLKNRLAELKAVITEKGVSKEWQEREVALKAIEEMFLEVRFETKEVLEDKFLQDCLVLLKSCFDENNMTIYLLAVQVGSVFFEKALVSDTVHGSLSSLILPMILRTTDTNTRVRKKSVELINQIWDHKNSVLQGDKLKMNQLRDSQQELSKATDSMCQIIAQVICDPAHGEKAIIGRLGLFIKRAGMIEGAKDLVNKPLQVVIGKNYEQLTEFACQWISHKNTKVRQNALKLIVEVCRINCMDPRGMPFKQRIINYIMALRSSQRDPLIAKINEVCRKHIVENTSPGRAASLEAFIQVNELDMGIAASKGRAASMDHVNAKRRLQSASRPSSKGGLPESALPSIGSKAVTGPNQYSGPNIVLPICEPLTEDQVITYQSLIDFFGLTLITCFVNKNWSTRLIAIQKVEEQLYNLDPNRRDAMSAEINVQNMPVELTFNVFLEFMFEGLKDPVLKNYISILELFQKALPTFFRYIQPQTIRVEIMHLIREILRKCTDMKQKIRESSINFCLYLSHQSPVGPEYMVDQVIQELDFVQNEKFQPKNKESAVAQNFGNSQLISSCLGLLNDYQLQTKIVTPASELLKKFLVQINASLKHSNPQVRKEAEKLFKTLYCDIGSSIESLLVDQKPQLVQKLVSQAKQEVLANSNNNASAGQAAPTKQEQTAEQKHELNVQRAQTQIRESAMNNTQLKQVLEGAEEHLQALKLPNPKKRQKAIVEIKKAISKKIVTQMSQEKARELFEPLTVLMRQLLQDENPDIYLEALNLLKFIVGGLAPFLSTLDLHLMMGSFIGIIVQNTATSSNMRIQVSSDKVIVFFAKHQNIGPFVVAKEINKNLEKINKAVIMAAGKKVEVLAEKKLVLLRFYSILQLLLQQFSIVLCYQPEFYIKCLECIADSMIISQGKGPQQDGEEAAVKLICSQIINNLYAIDYKLLDATVSKLDDIQRKTPLRKAIIELESQQKAGKGYLDVGKEEAFVSQINPSQSTEKQMRESAISFASSTNRQSLFSPGSTHTMSGFGASQYDNNWGKINNNEVSSTPGDSRQTRRMMSLGDRRNPGTNQGKTEDYYSNHPVSTLTQSSWRKPLDSLPAIDSNNLNRTGVLLPQIGQGPNMGSGLGNVPSYRFESGGRPPVEDKNSQKFKLKSTGGAGFSSQSQSTTNYEPSSAQRRTPRRTLGVLVNENNTAADPTGSSTKISWPSQAGKTMEKPPLYVPGKRQPSENKKGPQYVSKTGFSSLTTAPAKEAPFEENSKGIGAGFGQGGYVPSAATVQRQPSLGRPRSGRKQAEGAQFSMNNVKY